GLVYDRSAYGGSGQKEGENEEKETRRGDQPRVRRGRRASSDARRARVHLRELSAHHARPVSRRARDPGRRDGRQAAYARIAGQEAQYAVLDGVSSGMVADSRRR